MSANLFRAEVRAHAESSWLGRIVLIRPVSFALLCAVAGVFTAALLAFGLLGEYTRKARLTGVLEPDAGVIKILAQQSGFVESVLVREGERVAAETPLMTLGDGRAGGSREDVGSAVGSRLAQRQDALLRQRAYTAQAMRAEQAGFEGRKAGLARELVQLDAEIEAQEQRATIARRAVERARSLEGIGFLSGAALDRERDAQLDQLARLEALQRSRTSLGRELDALAFDRDGARSRAAAQLAAIDMQRAALDQEGLERGLQYHASIVAPGAGTVATVLVERGQMVMPGTPLATIIPAHSTLQAQLFAPSRSIGFVQPGQEVLLRYLAYPHQKFGSHRARVLAVSRDPLLPGELGFTPPDGSREPLYRIKAALASQSISAYGRREPLQPGMRVEADILLDRRRLIEWIFEPLLSLAGRA